MGLVQYLVFALMLCARPALASPLSGYRAEGDSCVWCPAGEFQKSCTECERCPDGKFTTERNREDICFRCFADCRPDYHLKVVANCTRTSDVKCVCEDGFRCQEKVWRNENCRVCVRIPQTTTTTTTTEAAVQTTGNNKQATPSISSSHTSASAKLCGSPKCGFQTVQPTVNVDMSSSKLAAILGPLVSMGCLALVILLCICRPRGETYFKQAIAGLCSGGVQDASHKSKESSHQGPRESFSGKQQPPSLSAANLGPVHVHNPGMVIFSYLSQFTGQFGPTVGGRDAAERVGNEEEEDERDFPVCQPTSSPSIHLSEEERSGETDSIFFPSQEQGKDCHMSKEEEL